MLAYRIESEGGSPSLQDVPAPEAGPGQLGISIRACGLNFADLLVRNGTYQDIPAAPFTMGMELSGVVTFVGAGSSGFSTGDRVMAFTGQGGLAESGVFDAPRVLRIPDSMSFEEAAAFPVAYGTGHLALAQRARLRAGETLLVTGAAGGVGLTAVELGKLMGARVIAQARGAEKLAVAEKAGADHLIDASEDLRARLLELGGVDVVYDAVGGAAFTEAFRACRPGGRLLPIGFASGEVPQIKANHLLVKNLDVIGVYIGAYINFAPDIFRESMAQLTDWYAEGLLKPHVSHVLPLSEVEQGMELLKSRKSTGKVVIRTTPD